jgi:hypothetical protein
MEEALGARTNERGYSIGYSPAWKAVRASASSANALVIRVGLTMQNAKTIITVVGNPLRAGLARARRT